MQIIKSDIHKIDLSAHVNRITRADHKNIFLDSPGNNHYKLLAYLSSLFNDCLIVELGTHHGTSSLAFSVNNRNKIITYDISDKYGIVPQPSNVYRRIGNIFDMREERNLLSASIIFLDTAHEGEFEQMVYEYLLNNNYQGLLLLDDIHWNDAMRKFWKDIDKTKYDVTDVGHGKCISGPGNYSVAGTGLVDFSGKIIMINE